MVVEFGGFEFGWFELVGGKLGEIGRLEKLGKVKPMLDLES